VASPGSVIATAAIGFETAGLSSLCFGNFRQLIQADNAAMKCDSDCLCPIAAAEFRKYVTRVNPDRALADGELVCDLFIGLAAGDKLEDLQFTGTELRAGDPFRQARCNLLGKWALNASRDQRMRSLETPAPSPLGGRPRLILGLPSASKSAGTRLRAPEETSQASHNFLPASPKSEPCTSGAYSDQSRNALVLSPPALRARHYRHLVGALWHRSNVRRPLSQTFLRGSDDEGGARAKLFPTGRYQESLLPPRSGMPTQSGLVPSVVQESSRR